MYTVEPLYCGQHWDKYKCPDYRGVLISGVHLYYKAQFGTFVSVLNKGVSSFQGVLNRGFHCISMLKVIHIHFNLRKILITLVWNDQCQISIHFFIIELQYNHVLTL